MTRLAESRHQAGFPAAMPPSEPTKVVESIDGLADIKAPGTELVIWRRVLSDNVKTWIEELDPACLPNARVLIHPEETPRAIGTHLDDGGMPADATRARLVTDIADLVSAFATITRTDLVDVRLERVEHDACWKFHWDCVEARLLTTYRGLATEWVQPPQAARALKQQRAYTGPLERMSTSDIALFKGSRAGPGGGIVHRSPALSGTGISRLLLVLNTPSPTSPDRWRPG